MPMNRDLARAEERQTCMHTNLLLLLTGQGPVSDYEASADPPPVAGAPPIWYVLTCARV